MLPHEQPAAIGSASKPTECRCGQTTFREVKDALDDFCNPLGSMAVGNSEFLHAGRIHSHTARDCSSSVADPIDPGPQAGCLTACRVDSIRLPRKCSKGELAPINALVRVHGGGSMDKDKVKGAIDDTAGRVKRQVGEWTGDTRTQIEGAAQQVKGKAEKVVGNLKDTVKDAKDDAQRDQEKKEKLQREQAEREHAAHSHR